MNCQEQLQADIARIESALESCFQGREVRGTLYDAMRYSLLAGGKRLRPVLVLEACRACGGDPERAIPFACAVEMVHTYSLIHDDLPCMDDDDLRRGRPTNHKVYGEGMAVLAGDGLLTAAFETVFAAADVIPPERVVMAGACLGRAAGARGMVGGQALDLAATGCALSVRELEELQALKTGALITASVELGSYAAGGSEAQRASLCAYARNLGRAFQIRDDMLDVAGDAALLGKPVGSDARGNKATFAAALGLEACRRQVESLTAAAVEAVSDGVFSDTEFLRWLAERLMSRTY